MSPNRNAPKQRETIKRRFQANMRRISGLVSFLNSPSSGLEPPVGFQSEGVRADIYRAVIVYLHATIEDFIRNILNPRKRFTFDNKSVLKKALHGHLSDIAPFEHLFAPMDQLAQRRQRIVHHADFEEASLAPWGIADHWQLIHWNLAVIAFYYRLLKSKGKLSIVEEKASQNADRVLVQNVELGNALLSFARSSQAATEVIRLSEEMVGGLKLTVDMFLNQE